MRRLLKALITPPLMLVAALLMFIEEVLWEISKRLMAQLGRLPLVRSLEAWIATLPPYGAACMFVLPAVLLLPVKIGALWLIARGHAVLGVQLIVAAKLAGTALVARIFTLTRPALMTLDWFARMYEFVMRWRERLYAFVRASNAWRAVERARVRLRGWMARMKPGRIALRLRAIRRLKRRASAR